MCPCVCTCVCVCLWVFVCRNGSSEWKSMRFEMISLFHSDYRNGKQEWKTNIKLLLSSVSFEKRPWACSFPILISIPKPIVALISPGMGRGLPELRGFFRKRTPFCRALLQKRPTHFGRRIVLVTYTLMDYTLSHLHSRWQKLVVVLNA